MKAQRTDPLTDLNFQPTVEDEIVTLRALARGQYDAMNSMMLNDECDAELMRICSFATEAFRARPRSIIELRMHHYSKAPECDAMPCYETRAGGFHP